METMSEENYLDKIIKPGFHYKYRYHLSTERTWHTIQMYCAKIKIDSVCGCQNSIQLLKYGDKIGFQ